MSMTALSIPSRLAAVLATASAAFACAGAHADATVDATVQGLRITLVDLDPADGIAPSLTFTGGDTAVQTIAYNTANTGHWSVREADALFAPLSGTSTLAGGAQGTASFSGDIYGSGMTMASAAMAVDGHPGGTGNVGQGNATIGLTSLPTWVLSPGTLLEISGNVQASASTTAPPALEDNATAIVDFQLSSDGVHSQRQSYHHGLLADAFVGDGSFSDSFDLKISNTGAQVMTGRFTGYVDVGAVTGPMVSVPEPGSPWLAVGGLGVLALVVRRRRAGAAT
jgi:uncharacterized protein (TIGR03382 family)